MSQLDDLLARSRSPGAFVERRSFTLSRDKAIEKQREFALRHPSQYVLELIQGAVFAGATYLAVDARSHSILVAWVGGRKLERRDLVNLLDYLFADRADPRTRHLVQLAVGVNAILQRSPRTLRIESGDHDGSIRVDLDHRGEGSVGTVENPIAGTYLYAEFSGGWFSRFLASPITPEAQLIEERCRYTPVPILLNGRAPFGYRGNRHIEIFGARHQAHFQDEEGRRGVVAIHSDPRVTGYRMVIGGVFISTHPLPELASEPLVGVICDDNLRKTADHSDVVQDWRFAKMLHAVQPHATRLLRERDPDYRPPRLPRVEEPASERAGNPAEAPREVLEPLPDPLPGQGPRRAVPVDGFKADRRRAPPGAPVFWCAPDDAEDIGHHADPHRFPFPLLVLTPGQAAALERALPDIPVHRVASRADVDFVRRAMDRRARTRTHRFRDRGAAVELTLHLEGDPPAWGPAGRGTPFCVVQGDRTALAGAVDGARVRLTVGPDDPAPLTQPVDLPGVSVRIEVGKKRSRAFDDVLADRVLAEAWHLAMPAGDVPHRPLLAALLGQVAIPTLVNGERAAAVSLPVGHPDGLRDAPLALDTDGAPISLSDLERVVGTDRVVALRDRAELRGLAPMEERLGHGHLWHADLAARPAWGVGHTGHRWTWLDTIEAWKAPLTQVIFVGATFRPRLGDQAWRMVAHPHPILVHAVRGAGPPHDAEAGWELLFRELLRMHTTDAWSRRPHPHGLAPARARGLGRLALLHLAGALGHEDEPLLLPTDGGARRSLRELRADPRVRLVARHGVQVSEPWTFALTADERAVIEADGDRLPLRYDDPPEVWASLAAADTGWLLREQVREGGLTGWLGLRHPYDATSGLLVRATGRLVGIPELDRRIPCHGLLWPEGEARVPTPEQEQILHLAGLRLYQRLVELLGTERDPERLETARRYAMHYAVRSAATGALTGTARELARRVEVRAPDGAVWGTLEAWLGAPAGRRPPLPDDLGALVSAPNADALVPVQSAAAPAELLDRLRAAVADPGVNLYLAMVSRPSGPPVLVLTARSHRDTVSLGLNDAHRLVRAAQDGDRRAREVLLLECARKICRWLHLNDRTLPLSAVQQRLVAQRLGTA